MVASEAGRGEPRGERERARALEKGVFASRVPLICSDGGVARTPEEASDELLFERHRSELQGEADARGDGEAVPKRSRRHGSLGAGAGRWLGGRCAVAAQGALSGQHRGARHRAPKTTKKGNGILVL